MDTEPDPIVAAPPYDGPHIPDQVVAAAKSVADLLRYLVVATRSADAVPTGPDLSAVLSHLADIGPRLGQVLRQLDAAAVRIADDPTLYDDQGGGGAVTAICAAVHCEEAAQLARALGQSVDEAHACAARLGHR